MRGRYCVLEISVGQQFPISVPQLQSLLCNLAHRRPSFVVMDLGSGDSPPQTFEESVSSWSDALSFSQASRLLDSSASNTWPLGEKDSTSSLAQALAVRWDDELLASTSDALSGSHLSDKSSSSPSTDPHLDSLDISLDVSEDSPPLVAESPYSRRNRSLSSSSSQPAFEAQKVRVPSLWRVMWSFLGRDFGLAGMLLLLQHAMLILPLVLLPTLMNYLQYGSSMVSEVKALVVTALIGVSLVLFAFLRAQASFLSGRLSLHFVSALRGLVFSKSLRLKFKPWDSRFSSFFTHLRLPRHLQTTHESTSHVAQFILFSLPIIEYYLLRFHELWTTPLLVIACIIQIWHYASLSTLMGLFAFAGVSTLAHFLGLRASEEEQRHAHRIHARDLHLEELLTHFKHIKQQCTDDFFEERLKSQQLAAASPSLFVWSLSFCVSIITPILASIATIFARTTLTGAPLSVQEFVLIHALFYLLHYFVQPYYELLRHTLKMHDIMDQIRLLLLEEETESFEYSNSILACARYAVLTQYHKLGIPVPQKPKASEAASTEMDEDRFGAFFEPPSDVSESPISMPLMRSPSAQDYSSSTTGMSHSTSASNLATSSTPISTPKKKSRPYAPAVDVIRIPAQHHIQLTDASFEWDASGKTRRLKNLSLNVRRGQLVVVLGSSESGKSSLFKALLGEMSLRSGEVKIEGSMSYAPQIPWTLNETLCFNITFYHEPPNMDRYNHVVSITGLKEDIERLEARDKTILSDAAFTPEQLARISLARCLYRSADIYLIDDLFSTFESVDVANKVLEQSIASTPGTRVLALSKYMPIIERADLIVHMSDGEILHEGTYQQMMEMEPDFAEALELSTKARQFMARKPLFHNTEPMLSPIESTRSPVAIDPTEVLAETLNLDPVHLSGPSFEHNGPKFTTGLRYYLRRVKLSTVWVVLGVLIAVIGVELTRFISSAFWFQSHNPRWPVEEIPVVAPNQMRLSQFPTVIVYTLLSGACAGLLVSAFWFFSRGALDASNKIWFALIDVVLHWPLSMLHNQDGAHIAGLMSFEAHRFQTLLPRHLHDIAYEMVTFTCFLLVSVAAAPISALTTLGTLGMSTRLHQDSRPHLSRLGRRHVKASMVLESCYESVLQGVVTVRAYEAEQRFTNAFYARQDEANALKLSTLLLTQHSNLRMGLWASIIPTGLCLCATILSLMGFQSASLFGVAVFFTLRVSESLPHLYHELSRLIVLIQALSNIRAIISHSPSEDPWYDAKLDPRSIWPSQGSITFSHITLRKKDSSPPSLHLNKNVGKAQADVHSDRMEEAMEEEERVDDGGHEHDDDVEDGRSLKKEDCSLWDVSLSIQGGSTVAICGQSSDRSSGGSGKSALVRALMRFDTPERHGVTVVSVGNVKISIDELDILRMGLHTLRKSVSIISPCVQTMTIREYLGEHVEEESVLWEALDRVGLKDKIAFSNVKLETMLRSYSTSSSSQSSSNPSSSSSQDFSDTELILLSMARAICRRTKIVIFKEPRAGSSDYDAKMVRQALLDNFGNKDNSRKQSSSTALAASSPSASSSSPKATAVSGSKSRCTLIIIANSPTFISSANRVFVMEDGEVVQQGTPEELASQLPNTAFNSLFRSSNEGRHANEHLSRHMDTATSMVQTKNTEELVVPTSSATTAENLIDL